LALSVQLKADDEAAPIARPISPDAMMQELVRVADEVRRSEPAMAPLVEGAILDKPSLADALCEYLAEKMANAYVPAKGLAAAFRELAAADGAFEDAAVSDLVAHYERNPACPNYLIPFLFYKGFHAIELHRLTHRLWIDGRETMASYLQSRQSELFGIDIHPAARIGKGVFIDHGTGIVIGETAVVEDCVSLLHGVTLGGTGKETGDRHPKIGHGSLLGAGAIVLGNVRVGHNVRVGAGSVVLTDVPDGATAVGVPARIIEMKRPGPPPAEEMDHRIIDSGR